MRFLLLIVFLSSWAYAQDITPPTAPQGLEAFSWGCDNLTSPDTHSCYINVSWLASRDNVAIADYLLDQSTDPTMATGVTTTNVGNATSRRISGLDAGTTYCYRVRARDTATVPNISPYSSPISCARTKSLLPPAGNITDIVYVSSTHSDTLAALSAPAYGQFDNNMGGHNCTFSVQAFQVDDTGESELFPLATGSNFLQCDVSTPTPGNYTLNSEAYPYQTGTFTVSTGPTSGPLVVSSTITAPVAYPYRYSVPFTVPAGQTTTRFRLTPTSGGAATYSIFIKRTLDNTCLGAGCTLSAQPTGTHPRLVYQAADIPGIQARIQTAGTSNKQIYDWIVQRRSSQSPGTSCATFANGNSVHDIMQTLMEFAFIAEMDSSSTVRASFLTKTKGQLDYIFGCSATIESASQGAATLGFHTQVTSAIVALDMIWNDLTPTEQLNYTRKAWDYADRATDSLLVAEQAGRYTPPTNWKAVFASSVCAGAYGLDNSPASSSWATFCIDNNIQVVQDSFSLSGENRETAEYFGFTFETFAWGAQMIKNSTGLNLFTYGNNKLQKSHQWLREILFPDNSRACPYGDSLSGFEQYVGPSAIMAKEYGDQNIRFWIQDRLPEPPTGPSTFNFRCIDLTPDTSTGQQKVFCNWHEWNTVQFLINNNPSQSKAQPSDPLNHFYDTLQNYGWHSSRTAYFDPNASFMCGENKDFQAFHGDPSCGHVSMYSQGQAFVFDPGKGGEYGSTESVWASSSTAHNVFMINGTPTNFSTGGQWPEGNYFLLNWCHIGSRASLDGKISGISIDSSNAYNYRNFTPVISSSNHALMIVNPNGSAYFIKVDDINKNNLPQTYTELWALNIGEGTWSANGANWLATGTKANINLLFAEPPTSVAINNSYGPGTVPLVASLVTTFNTSRALSAALLYPGILPTVTKTSDTFQAGFNIGSSDFFRYNKFTTAFSDSTVPGFDNSGLITDGSVNFVRNAVDLYYSTNVSSLLLGGTQLALAPGKLDSITCSYGATSVDCDVQLGNQSQVQIKSPTPTSVSVDGTATTNFTASGGQTTVTQLFSANHRAHIVINTAVQPTTTTSTTPTTSSSTTSAPSTTVVTTSTLAPTTTSTTVPNSGPVIIITPPDTSWNYEFQWKMAA